MFYRIGCICFLFLIVLQSTTYAQKQDSVQFYILVEATADTVRNALFYQEARDRLIVELIEVEVTPNGVENRKKHKLTRNASIDKWTKKLPVDKLYRIEIHDIGFDPYRSRGIIQPTTDQREWAVNLTVDTLPRVYRTDPFVGVYGDYAYIPGSYRFAETVLVYFKEGLPSENRAFLEDGALKDTLGMDIRKVTQMHYAENAFYVTLGIPDHRNVDQLLYLEDHPELPQDRGFYNGPMIKAAIDMILKNDKVYQVFPSFYYDEFAIANMVNPEDEDYPEKSRRLQRKLGDIYYEYEEMIEELKGLDN